MTDFILTLLAIGAFAGICFVIGYSFGQSGFFDDHEFWRGK